jgi:rRNA-processing protein FCF1
MAARRKTRTLALSDQPYLLTALIEKTSLSIKDQRALLKDKPLIEAALACDKIILTRDRSLRQTLERYQRLRGIAKDIRWINPEIEGPHSIEQL